MFLYFQNQDLFFVVCWTVFQYIHFLFASQHQPQVGALTIFVRQKRKPLGSYCFVTLGKLLMSLSTTLLICKMGNESNCFIGV